MKTAQLRLTAMALAAALLTAQTPTRDANIWNGQDHQPTEAQVQQKEQAAGVAPTPSETASSAAAEDRIYQRLMSSK
jgi:hypothetical protein